MVSQPLKVEIFDHDGFLGDDEGPGIFISLQDIVCPVVRRKVDIRGRTCWAVIQYVLLWQYLSFLY